MLAFSSHLPSDSDYLPWATTEFPEYSLLCRFDSHSNPSSVLPFNVHLLIWCPTSKFLVAPACFLDKLQTPQLYILGLNFWIQVQGWDLRIYIFVNLLSDCSASSLALHRSQDGKEDTLVCLEHSLRAAGQLQMETSLSQGFKLSSTMRLF